jgi:hypothetical protein
MMGIEGGADLVVRNGIRNGLAVNVMMTYQLLLIRLSNSCLADYLI